MTELAAPVWVRSLVGIALLGPAVACSGSAERVTEGSVPASDASSSTSTAGVSTSTVSAASTSVVAAGSTGGGGNRTTDGRWVGPIDPTGTSFVGAFDAFIGGGDPGPGCQDWWDAVPSTPYIGAGREPDTTLTRGDDRQLCIAGFDVTAPISLTVVEPFGEQRVLTLTAADTTDIEPTDLLDGAVGAVALEASNGYIATKVAQLDPSTPLGVYQLIARQGDREAEWTPTVVSPAADPYGGWLKPQDAWGEMPQLRAGDVRPILLLGFPPNATVPLAVYRVDSVTDQARFTFVQELQAARVGSEGWAYHDVVIPSGLTPLTESPAYCIVTVPALAAPSCQRGFAPVFSFVDDPTSTTVPETIQAPTTSSASTMASTSVATSGATTAPAGSLASTTTTPTPGPSTGG